MSWIHSSKGAILGAVLVCSLMAVGTVAAVSISGDAPAPAENGTEVSMTVTLEDPFANAPDQWTLRGETQLVDPNWNVEVLNQGRLVTRQDTAGPNVTQPLDFDEGATLVNVTVTGTVPNLTAFDYENQDAENYYVMNLTQQNGNAVSETWTAHRYTAGSKTAREAIDAARAAVEEADGVGEEDLQQAISAYNAANFENAESLAADAQSAAEESQGGLPIVLIAAAVVVLLLVAGGGYYYYQSQQGSDYKLQ